MHSANLAAALQAQLSKCHTVRVFFAYTTAASTLLAKSKSCVHASVLPDASYGFAALCQKTGLRHAHRGFLCIGLVQRLTKMAAFDTAVPTVDISPFTAPEAHSDAARRAVGQEWDAAMTNVGFAMITGHGVDPAIVDALRRGAHSFFGGPADAKQKYCYGPYGNPLGGFTGMGVEAVARSRDDHGSDGGATQTTALPDFGGELRLQA